MKSQILKQTIASIVLSLAFLLSFSQDCTQCNNTTTGTNASAIGENTSATGDYSFAGGFNSSANSGASFAFGNTAVVDGAHSFALGGMTTASSANSFAIGSFCKANSTNSFVIGSGSNSSTILTNSTSYSLMIGISSDKPTFFVGQSNGPGTSGRIGIGNITDPQAKLHIKADDGEQATLFVEPFLFTGGESAKLRLGTMNYGVSAGNGRLYFDTGGNYIFNSTDANVGIGVLLPAAKLQVKGDIFIDDENSGLILKSPDGQCWKATASNDGSFVLESIDCDLTTKTDDLQTQEAVSVQIYPNPSKGKVYIRCNTDEVLYAGVLDLDGTLLLTKELKGLETEISIKNFVAGYYIIRITDSKNQVVSTEKIVKE